jgi:hypothetical protein
MQQRTLGTSQLPFVSRSFTPRGGTSNISNGGNGIRATSTPKKGREGISPQGMPQRSMGTVRAGTAPAPSPERLLSGMNSLERKYDEVIEHVVEGNETMARCFETIREEFGGGLRSLSDMVQEISQQVTEQQKALVVASTPPPPIQPQLSLPPPPPLPPPQPIVIQAPSPQACCNPEQYNNLESRIDKIDCKMEEIAGLISALAAEFSKTTVSSPSSVAENNPNPQQQQLKVTVTPTPTSQLPPQQVVTPTAIQQQRTTPVMLQQPKFNPPALVTPPTAPEPVKGVPKVLDFSFFGNKNNNTASSVASPTFSFQMSNSTTVPPSVFAQPSFSFGGEASSLKPATPPQPQQRQRSTSQGSEGGGEDDFVPTAEFKPVIPLPPLVETKLGDENENVIFDHR